MKKKNKNFKKNSGNFQKNRDRKDESIAVANIDKRTIGKKFILRGVIDRVAQTSGPTLFALSDGTGTFMLKGFEGQGTRAFANINEKDAVSAFVEIREYNNMLEGEIFRMTKLSHLEATKMREEIQEKVRKKAKPATTEFSISSELLEKLKPRFIEAATQIRLAVLENRPIIVRHHNDADGYASGFSLEKAIKPLIEKQHGGGKSAWEYFTRAPCSAPLYEIDDSIRDSSRSLSDVAKFSNKMPLVIIADNGSSEDDLIAIQHGKVLGMDFIVIDHHYFDEDVISKEVLVHINPFLIGETGDKFSAGMLCSELARFISPVENMESIAAMAGLADRISNADAISQYLKAAEKQGYSKQLLADIATVISFVSAKLKFMEAREYIEVVFGEPRETQKALVSLMAPYIRNLESKGLAIAKSAAKMEKIGNKVLQYMFIEESFPGFGFYPKPGRCVELIHDYAQFEKKTTALITAGLMNTAITFRATNEADFSVHDFIDYIDKKLPEAFVEGGGHKNAGSVNFIPGKKEEVIKLLKEFLKERS